jgi:glutaredoxin
MTATQTREYFRVFWQPGCSSCVKVKEFLDRIGVEYESVNCLNNPDAMRDLERLGVRTIPLVSQGNRFTFAQSLDEVAKFVGKSVAKREMLEPDVLANRWLHILRSAEGYVEQIPPARFRDPIFPGRERTIGQLAYHVFQIPHAFLETVENNVADWTIITNTDAPATVASSADILRYAHPQTERLARWWERQSQRPIEEFKNSTQKAIMYSGERVMHEFLERSTWHSAQHTRQLIAVLESLNVKLKAPLGAADYANLPMPAGLWT